MVFESLVGLDAPLLPGPGLRLVVPGFVFARPAEVQVDVASPLTVVTAACFDEPMVRAERVKLADPLRRDAVYPLTRLAGLTVGGRRLRVLDAGLADGRDCSVTLGADLLSGVALEVDVARRLLRFLASRPKAEWLASLEARGGEGQLLDLTRDPRHDWPLLAVRLTQGEQQLTGAFLFSTRERASRVFEEPARAAGLVAGAELLRALGLPKEAELPKALVAALPDAAGLVVDRAELAPGVGPQAVAFVLSPGPARLGLSGVLASDVWGRFDATIDVSAGVLLLHRPRLLTSGHRAQCARGEVNPSEEACFELHQARKASGLVVAATVWRSLPQGGRLYLDFPGRSPVCRMGFTFDAGDRGRSTQHVLPWPRLFETMKDCADSVSPAPAVSLGLFEEGPLRECSGVCAFAQHLRSGRVSCECQSGPQVVPPEAQRLLLEKLRARVPAGPDAGAQEPGDPEPTPAR